MGFTDEEIAYMFRRAADVLEGVEEPDTADEPAEPENDSDPWGGTNASRQRPSQGRSQPRSHQASRSAPRGSARGGQASSRAQGRSQGRSSAPAADLPTSGEHEDRNGKMWFFGDENAPQCEHRMAAAYVTGIKGNGDEWHAWACPIGFGEHWKDKCAMWDFTS